jgi:predicted ATP-dependent serine protease
MTRSDGIKTGISWFDSIFQGNRIPRGAVIVLGGAPAVGKTALAVQVLTGAVSHAEPSLFFQGGAGEALPRGVATELAVPPFTLDTFGKASAVFSVIDGFEARRWRDLHHVKKLVSRSSHSNARHLGSAFVVLRSNKQGTMSDMVEHPADVVLKLERDLSSSRAVLRVKKNRFGGLHVIDLDFKHYAFRKARAKVAPAR